MPVGSCECAVQGTLYIIYQALAQGAVWHLMPANWIVPLKSGVQSDHTQEFTSCRTENKLVSIMKTIELTSVRWLLEMYCKHNQ